MEGDDVTLHCELSKPGVHAEWRKGGVVLQPGKKYEMRQQGCIQELRIRNLEPEDNGFYTCDAGDQLTTASLAVQGIPSQHHYISTLVLCQVSQFFSDWFCLLSYGGSRIDTPMVVFQPLEIVFT